MICSLLTRIPNPTSFRRLPRHVSDSIDEDGDDSDYAVMVDGLEEPGTVDDFGEDVRTLTIPFASESEEIDITGTFLLLESTED